jgi:hypothetical protein
MANDYCPQCESAIIDCVSVVHEEVRFCSTKCVREHIKANKPQVSDTES